MGENFIRMIKQENYRCFDIFKAKHECLRCYKIYQKVPCQSIRSQSQQIYSYRDNFKKKYNSL